MKIKTAKKEELETMSYDDIAYIILKEKGKKMKITDLFKTICDNLELSEREYEEKIGDFFALLATEKRFIQLDKGFWDLRENHTSKVVIKADDIEEDDIIEEEIEEDTEEEDIYDTKEVDDDEEEDDLKDLVIVEEEDAEL